MIIACPACHTRYLVPDQAIGEVGRRVRCAHCRHSWYQDGSVADMGRLTVAAPAAADAAATGAEADDGFAGDPFAPAPPFRPRRNPARLWTWAAIAVAVLACAGIGALVAFGVPAGLGIAGTATAAGPIRVFTNPVVRKQPMPSGSELLVFSGRLFNSARTTARVPNIRAELRDAGGRVVYGWTIAAPVPELGGGRSYWFSGAELDVPRSATSLQLAPAADGG